MSFKENIDLRLLPLLEKYPFPCYYVDTPCFSIEYINEFSIHEGAFYDIKNYEKKFVCLSENLSRILFQSTENIDISEKLLADIIKEIVGTNDALIIHKLNCRISFSRMLYDLDNEIKTITIGVDGISLPNQYIRSIINPSNLFTLLNKQMPKNIEPTKIITPKNAIDFLEI